MIVLVVIQAVALVAVVGLFLFERDRSEARLAAERDKDRQDRQVWANRVQAPDTAVAQTLPDAPVGPLFVSPESDEDWYAEVQRRTEELNA